MSEDMNAENEADSDGNFAYLQEQANRIGERFHSVFIMAVKHYPDDRVDVRYSATCGSSYARDGALQEYLAVNEARAIKRATE